MKKALLIIAFLSFVSILENEAQISKGKFLIGVSSVRGFIGYDNLGSDLFGAAVSTIKSQDEYDSDTKISRIGFMPKAGYFLSDHLAAGLDLFVYTLGEKYGPGEKFSSFAYGAGPFARYYFSSGKIIPLLEAAAMVGSGTTKMEYKSDIYSSSDKSKFGFSSLCGAAGISVRLGNKATFDILAGYNKFTINSDTDGPDPDKTKTGTTSLKIGFTMILGGGEINNLSN